MIVKPFSFLNHQPSAPSVQKVLVVVGTDFAARSTDDGLTWTQSTIPNGNWQKVCTVPVTLDDFFNPPIDCFVAVGSNASCFSIDGGQTFQSLTMPTGDWVDVSSHSLPINTVRAVRSNNGRQVATAVFDALSNTFAWSTSNMPNPTPSGGVTPPTATSSSRGISRGSGGSLAVTARIQIGLAQSGANPAAGSLNNGFYTRGPVSWSNRNVGVSLSTTPYVEPTSAAEARHAAVSQRIGGAVEDSDCLVCFRAASGSSNNIGGSIRFSTNNGDTWSNTGAPNRNYDRIAMARGQVDGRLKAFAITSNNTNFLKLTKEDHSSPWVTADSPHPQNSAWSDVIYAELMPNVDDTKFYAVASSGTNRFAVYDTTSDLFGVLPIPLLDSQTLMGITYGEYQP